MPSLTALDASHGPRADPLSYPGEIVDASYLWLGSGLPVAARHGCQLRAVAHSPRRRATGRHTRRQSPKLDRAARCCLRGPRRWTSVTRWWRSARTPAPAQLRDKFQVLDPVERAIPVTRASLRGLVLAHSPHVSDPGYLPYVLVDGGAPPNSMSACSGSMLGNAAA